MADTFPENMAAYRSWRSTNRQYAPWRVFGSRGTDAEQRVNFERLRAQRLGKLQTAIRQEGLAALLLTTGDAIRYACAPPDVFYHAGKATGRAYALVFTSGRPLLFETVGPDAEIAEMHCPWLEGRVRPAIVYANAEAATERQLTRWAEQVADSLSSEGVVPGERVGVDALGFAAYDAIRRAGVRLEAGGSALRAATLTKTPDEIELLKQAAQLSDICFHKAKQEWVAPGVRECEVVGKIMDFYVSNGGHATGAIVATGCNTNPLFRSYTDKLINRGDMCIVDVGFATYMGYGSDFTRCWPVAAAFTPSQRIAYDRCLSSLQGALAAIRPGATSGDIASALMPDADDVYQTGSVLQAAHSIGIGGADGFLATRGWSIEYPRPLVKDMVLAVETYCALPDGAAARLEENIVITDTGYELLSTFPFEAPL